MKLFNEFLINMQTNGLRVEYEERFGGRDGIKEDLVILVHPTKTIVAVLESSGQIGLNNNDVHLCLDVPPVSYESDLFQIFDKSIFGHHYRQAFEVADNGGLKRRAQIHAMYHGVEWLRNNLIDRFVSDKPFEKDTTIYTINYMEWNAVSRFKYGAATKKSRKKLKKCKSFKRLFIGG